MDSIIEEEEEIMEQAELESDLPTLSTTDLKYFRLIDCFLAEELKRDFLQRNCISTRSQLDARNSSTVVILDYWQKVAALYNDENFVVHTQRFPSFCDKLSLS